MSKAIKTRTTRKALLIPAGKNKNEFQIIDLGKKDATEILKCKRVSILPVEPVRTDDKIFEDLLLIVDEEGLLVPDSVDNWYSSLLYNPFAPNSLVGDAILYKEGKFTEADIKNILENHPILNEEEEEDDDEE